MEDENDAFDEERKLTTRGEVDGEDAREFLDLVKGSGKRPYQLLEMIEQD